MPMRQAYLKTHSLHLASLSMSPQVHMSRVTYLIASLQRKHQASDSPPARPVPLCQITRLWLQSSTLTNIQKRRSHYQYVNFTALPRRVLNQPSMRVPSILTPCWYSPISAQWWTAQGTGYHCSFEANSSSCPPKTTLVQWDCQG